MDKNPYSAVYAPRRRAVDLWAGGKDKVAELPIEDARQIHAALGEAIQIADGQHPAQTGEER